MPTPIPEIEAIPFLKYAWQIIAAIGSAVVGGSWWMFNRLVKKHDEEMHDLRHGISEKLDRKVWEDYRDDTRDTIREMFEKIDTYDARGQERHGEVMRTLIDMKAEK